MIVQYGNNLKSLKEEWFCDFSMPTIVIVVQSSEIMLTKNFLILAYRCGKYKIQS